jgi:hypothetical protein
MEKIKWKKGLGFSGTTGRNPGYDIVRKSSLTPLLQKGEGGDLAIIGKENTMAIVMGNPPNPPCPPLEKGDAL